jgi:hypothetical protein
MTRSFGSLSAKLSEGLRQPLVRFGVIAFGLLAWQWLSTHGFRAEGALAIVGVLLAAFLVVLLGFLKELALCVALLFRIRGIVRTVAGASLRRGVSEIRPERFGQRVMRRFIAGTWR